MKTLSDIARRFGRDTSVFFASKATPSEACFALVAFNILWLPSLAFGFLWDDATHVMFSFEQAWRRAEEHAFRPLYLLSFPLVSELFGADAWVHRAINLGFLNVALIYLYRLFVAPSRAVLLAFAMVFTHPAILFPATWIAARNDAMLLALVAIGLFQLRCGGTGAVPAMLSLLCKAPFVLHGVVFGVIAGVRRRMITSGFIMASVLAMVWLSFNSGYRKHVDSQSLVGQFSPDWWMHLAARAAKGLEALFLVFAPFPAFFHVSWWAASIPLFLIIWMLMFVGRGRFGLGNLSLPSVSELKRHYGFWLLLAGLLTLPPMVFNSQMRVLSVAVVLLQLGLMTLCKDLPSRAPLLMMLFCLHLTGLLQNYRLSDTGYMIPSAVPANERVDGFCQTNRLPISHWDCERNKIIRKISGLP